MIGNCHSIKSISHLEVGSLVAPAFVEADVDDDAAAPCDDDAAPSAPDPDDVDGLLSSSGGSGNMKREQSVLTRILT